MPATTSGLTPAMMAQANEANALAYAAVTRMKERHPARLPYQDILDYLLPNDQQSNAELTRLLRLSLQKNGEVAYDPVGNTYRYKPPYDITNAEELLAALQGQELYKGIQFSELKPGWPDCLGTINKLAEERKIIVHRQKKDKQPKLIWADDPALYVDLSEEFRVIANRVPLPDVDKIRLELAGMQSRAAGEAPKPVNAANAKTKGPKKVRRGQKVTNTHMQALDAIMKGYGKK